jgi:hypothetical protein
MAEALKTENKLLLYKLTLITNGTGSKLRPGGVSMLRRHGLLGFMAEHPEPHWQGMEI